jgi:hypothetical protein
MISAQTRFAFVARENRCTLFRIMLQVTSQLQRYYLLAVEVEAANDAARGVTRDDCLHHF